MKKLTLAVMCALLFSISTAANATSNLALGKIQAIKVFDRGSAGEYIQVIFATTATVYATGCEESLGGGTPAVAYITYASHVSNNSININMVNMWLSELMAAYEAGITVRITGAGGTDPCEVDMIALENSNI